MKKQVVVIMCLLMSVSLFAQKGVEDGSKFGHGEDSIRCIQNLSLYRTYAKQNDFATALEFWEIAYKECPSSSVNLYIDGAKIRTWQLKKATDPAKKMEYFNLLMQVYDQRVQYFGDYIRAPKPYVLGRKAVDYFTLHPEGENSDKKPAYEWLKVCVEESSIAQFTPAYAPYFIIASRAMLDDPAHKEQFFSDYLKVMEVLDAKIAMTKDTVEQAKIRGYKADIDDLFIASGVADCISMESIFSTGVEENKTDLVYLKKVVSLFKRTKCTDTDVYFAASQYAHQLEPTAESAEGCAYMCIKKGDYKTAADYLTEAVNMESDNIKKAEYEFLAASAFFAGKDYATARTHALNAVSYNPNYGAPYVLIAKMYANSVEQFDDAVTKRVVYCAAVDKLQKAKSVDPSVAEEVDNLIPKYKEQYPGTEDVFMHPDVSEGKPYRIKGWINESTIVRVK